MNIGKTLAIVALLACVSKPGVDRIRPEIQAGDGTPPLARSASLAWQSGAMANQPQSPDEGVRPSPALPVAESYPPTAKPGTYWWWMGSAVDSANLSWNLESLHAAGIGGVLVIPIYGVKGYEERFVDYLSPRWMRLFSHAVREAKRLGMWIDMTTGTGWPFGGEHVTPEYGAKRLVWRIRVLPRGVGLDTTVVTDRLVGIYLISDNGEVRDITRLVESTGRLRVAPHTERQRVLFVTWELTRQRVKRAAPGNEGLVLDPFSPEAMHFYLFRFDTAFARSGSPWPRAQYHDSYEYYGANWTPRFLAEFRARRGYDLRPFLPLLLGIGDADSVARVKHDYRQTLSELHLEYMRTWVEWAHGHGCLTRNEAHGAPANLLDLYAVADIPETETFGSTPFPIPGLRRRKENIREDEPNPIVLRFASSAAHVSGNNLVSSESCTWLREHFKTALSQVKPEIDQLFCAGINHLSYHGSAYSPAEAPWPGWLFYASVAFQPANTIWRDFPALNAYVERCQQALQSGAPDNDLLFYWPVHDLWQDTTGLQRQLTVHDTWWVDEHPYGRLADTLLAHGYTFDFISDRLLGEVRVDSGFLLAGGNRYAALLVPPTKTIPLGTWWKIEELVRQGATVLFSGALPADVPGLFDYPARRRVLLQAQARLSFVPAPRCSSVRLTKLGTGCIFVSPCVDSLLRTVAIQPEELGHTSVQFIRRKTRQGWLYFVANLGSKVLDRWVRLERAGKTALIEDPQSGMIGLADIQLDKGATQIYLQLEPGQSCLIHLLRESTVQAPRWPYFRRAGDPIPLNGTWKVEFVEGGPQLPRPFETATLKSWTDFGDLEAARFAGTARYTLVFRLPQTHADDWLLDLGEVRESARVRINGEDVGVLWSLPFSARVGRYLKPGWNTLEVEVTNLAANRIRDLDRRGVPWKRFYDINFVNIRYRPFDASSWEIEPSGLLGPVRLVPLVAGHR